jgi:RNA polymerase sigma factor (sigma-70 family)
MESDRSLLRRFLAGDDQAFQTLVTRYAQMVLATCQRILRDHHAAEDAAQMTFETLARKGQSIRQHRSVAAWLHGVAYRRALRQRTQAARRNERLDVDISETADECWPDIQRRHELELLDEELEQLPAKYRQPLVLHYLLGRSQKRMAEDLGLRESTVKGRLQRGRNHLRRRLVARGVRCSLILAIVRREALSAELRVPVDAETIAQWSLRDTVRPTGDVQPDSLFSFASRSLTMRLHALPCLLGTLAVLAGGIGLSLCFGTTSGLDDSLPVQRIDQVFVAAAEDSRPGRAEATVLVAQATASPPTGRATTLLQYGDQKPDGRKSIAGTGEMIRFRLPTAQQRVRAIKIHGSRYGYPRPPAEDFEVNFLNEDMSQVLHKRTAPYSLFQRGDSKWVTIRFDQPLEVSEVFWVVVNFNAERTKGVYVSYDSSTSGENSRIGLPPDQPSRETGFEGDWMIEAVLTRDGADAPTAG